MEKINQVFEPVEVIVHFNRLKIVILRFKWNDEVYKVTEMLQSWKIPAREGFVTHYVVICKDRNLLCELSFNNTDLKWELVKHDLLI
ncbi:MAG: hypothetical protein SGI89_07335 [bacterium]|nr:hypothetical protein [bacterium]